MSAAWPYLDALAGNPGGDASRESSDQSSVALGGGSEWEIVRSTCDRLLRAERRRRSTPHPEGPPTFRGLMAKESV